MTAYCVFLPYSVKCFFQQSGVGCCPPLERASTKPHSVTLKWKHHLPPKRRSKHITLRGKTPRRPYIHLNYTLPILCSSVLQKNVQFICHQRTDPNDYQHSKETIAYIGLTVKCKTLRPAYERLKINSENWETYSFYTEERTILMQTDLLRNSMFDSHLVKSDFSLRVQKSIINVYKHNAPQQRVQCVFYTTEQSHTLHKNDLKCRYSGGPDTKIKSRREFRTYWFSFNLRDPQTDRSDLS
jgi:hypothetical protein